MVPAAAPDPSDVDVTVVISTKNRLDTLRDAVASAVRQRGRVEVLLMDDGSTDGTSAEIAAAFPTVRIVREEQSKGYIVQRNRGAALARGRILISIDDDAVLTTDTIAEQLLTQFDHPRIGVVAIPVCHVNSTSDVHQKPPTNDGIWATNFFIGTAYAVRRDVFLALGGFRESYFHQGEERDFALRMLAAGYIIRLGNTDRIDHFESPRRSFTRMDRFGRRNDILYAWYNVPLLPLPLVLARFTAGGLRHGIRTGRLWNMIVGLAWGFGHILSGRGARRPVPNAVWKLLRHLRTPRLLNDIETRLPPPATLPQTPAPGNTPTA